jgi:hypothetical protein
VAFVECASRDRRVPLSESLCDSFHVISQQGTTG